MQTEEEAVQNDHGSQAICELIGPVRLMSLAILLVQQSLRIHVQYVVTTLMPSTAVVGSRRCVPVREQSQSIEYNDERTPFVKCNGGAYAKSQDGSRYKENDHS